MSFWKEKWRILKLAWRETHFRWWDGDQGPGLTSSFLSPSLRVLFGEHNTWSPKKRFAVCGGRRAL